MLRCQIHELLGKQSCAFLESSKISTLWEPCMQLQPRQCHFGGLPQRIPCYGGQALTSNIRWKDNISSFAFCTNRSTCGVRRIFKNNFVWIMRVDLYSTELLVHDCNQVEYSASRKRANITHIVMRFSSELHPFAPPITKQGSKLYIVKQGSYMDIFNVSGCLIAALYGEHIGINIPNTPLPFYPNNTQWCSYGSRNLKVRNSAAMQRL